jgi:hypothetical protein
MVKHEVLPSGARLLESETTRAKIWLETPKIICWIIEGNGSLEVVKRVVQELEELAPKEGDFVVFNDTDRMPSYDPGFRNVLTDWSGSKGERLKAIHILTRSKVVAMGAAVANLMLGGNVKMYADRGGFEAAFIAAGGSPNQFRKVA